MGLRSERWYCAWRRDSRVGHRSWCGSASRRSDAVAGSLRQLALATWSPDRRPPRIGALVIDRDAIVDSDAETLSALGRGGWA